MIIVDTSIWIDQLYAPDAQFSDLLFRQMVVIHPYVIGEILLGNLRGREIVKRQLFALDQPPVADMAEVFNLIESAELFGSGVGYVDAHLVASALLSVGGRIWTRDNRLAKVAGRLGISFQPAA